MGITGDDILLFAGGAAIFAVQNALAAGAAHLLARRLVPRPEGRAHAALVFALVWVSLVVASLLALGLVGLLRPQWIVASQAALFVAAAALWRGQPGPIVPWPDPRGAVQAAWAALARRPAVAVLYAALGAAAAMLVWRGLTRPPLAWDALMYHLLLPALWLQDGAFTHFFAPYAMSYFAYFPANGSLLCLWNMAPFHGELLVSLTFVPWFAVLGLGVYACARELGPGPDGANAALLGPLLVLPAPVVLRYMHTAQVDVFLGGLQICALYFLLRHRRTQATADALLLGAALGVGAGTKHLGLLYGMVLGLGWLAYARPRWTQAALALAPALALGSFFYLRNVGLTGNPVFPAPLPDFGTGLFAALPAFEYAPWPQPGWWNGPGTLVTDFQAAGGWRVLIESLLGFDALFLREAGIGPRVLLLFTVPIVLPFVTRGETRRAAVLLAMNVAAHAWIFAAVPPALHYGVYGNLRYLVPALAFAAVAGAALLARVPPMLALLVTAVLLAVDLALVATALPLDFRAFAAVALLAAAVALALRARARFRARAARPWPFALRGAAAALAVALAVGAGGALLSYRREHRYPHFRTEVDPFPTPARYLGAGWEAVERLGAERIAFVALPRMDFAYPLLGADYQRRVTYLNVDTAGLRVHSAYADGLERAAPDRRAWLRRVNDEAIDALVVARNEPAPDFPLEDAWARERPSTFEWVYEDPWTHIFKVRR